MENNDIDLVVPYVDSSDPNWQELFNKYNPHKNEEGVDAPNRFRGNDDLFRFFFRGVEANMPWIRKIHLIVQSESQIPSWINKDNVHIVLHKDIIPEEFLPTFNSTVIEMFLWNIDGLSEKFLYANDDFYVIKKVFPADFFMGDKVRFNFNKLPQSSCGSMYLNHTMNVVKVIDNIEPNFGFVVYHAFRPYFKSRMIACFNEHKEEILKRLTRFRDEGNTNCYLFNYYDFAKGYRMASSLKYKYCSLSNTSTCTKIIDEGNYNLVTINDNCLQDPDSTSYNKIIKSFKNKFNFVSKYEKISEDQVPDWYLERLHKILKNVPDELKETIKYQLLKTYIAG